MAGTFPPSLSSKAARSQQRLGVTVLTSRTLIGVNGVGLYRRGGGPGGPRISIPFLMPIGMMRAMSGGASSGGGRLASLGARADASFEESEVVACVIVEAVGGHQRRVLPRRARRVAM
jgi:hypothetical protein